tara:strand:+ start:14161 stop:14313 length:153 start_codon:yes stop_codon:yes gene_type:complete
MNTGIGTAIGLRKIYLDDSLGCVSKNANKAYNLWRVFAQLLNLSNFKKDL